jgi:hypothetical protein
VERKQGRPPRLTRKEEPPAWGSIALAIGIAAVGVQVGRLTWRTQAAPPPTTALRSEPAPSIPLEPALGHRMGSANPGVGRLARGTPSSPFENGAPGESQTPSPASPLSPQPPNGFIGPIAPVGPGYVGKPLPLPNQAQVRYLLRHDPLASVPAADPLRIAPLTPPAPVTPSKSGAHSLAASARIAPASARPPKEVAAAHPAPGDPMALAPGLPPLATRLSLPTTLAPSILPQSTAPASGTPGAAVSGGEPGGADASPRSPAAQETSSGAAPASPGTSSNAAPSVAAPGSSPSAPAPDASPAPVTTVAPSPGTLPAAGTATVPPGETKGEGTERRPAIEEPLRLQLAISDGSGRRFAPGQMALVHVTASAPCHVAVYRIDAFGRITPLLSLAGSARMKPASAFSLAARVSPTLAGKTPDQATGAVSRERVIAIGSRRPLSARDVELCLRGFTPAGDEKSSDPAQPVQEMPLAAALRALADYAGRQPAGLTAAPGGATPASATCAVASFLVEAR